MGIDEFFRKGKKEALTSEEQEKRQKKAPPKKKPRIHVVRPGESLSKIAKEYYGDAMKWKIIYEANEGKISNPDLIHPGEEFIIPTLPVL